MNILGEDLVDDKSFRMYFQMANLHFNIPTPVIDDRFGLENLTIFQNLFQECTEWNKIQICT